MNNNKQVIDPVSVKSRYAVYSTYANDVFFRRNEVKTPIFCGGIVEDFNQNVSNLKKSEFVGFVRYEKQPDLILSTNLIIPISDKNDLRLIAVFPYASFAMKILRIVKPTLTQKILIIGDGFFSVLLKKLFDLSGAQVINITMDDFENLEYTEISMMIYSKSQPEIKEIVSKLLPKHQLELSTVSIYDIGLEDFEYQKGKKYPFPYIRWDYKRNLEYFVNLVKHNSDFLKFLEIEIVEVEKFDEMLKKLNQLNKNLIYLFKKIVE